MGERERTFAAREFGRPVVRIFIAGPYMADTPEKIQTNVNHAIAAGLAVFKKGHDPFIPHLFHFMDDYAKREGIPMTEADYRSLDMEWLRQSEAILVLAISDGVNWEIAEAKDLRLKRFNSVAEVPEAVLL